MHRSLCKVNVKLNSFHDGGRYHIETSPLICSANQWTGFYTIMASVMKELNICFLHIYHLPYFSCSKKIFSVMLSALQYSISQSCFQLCNILFCNTVRIIYLFYDGGLYHTETSVIKKLISLQILYRRVNLYQFFIKLLKDIRGGMRWFDVKWF